MSGENEHFERDEDLALRLQQQEFDDLLPSYFNRHDINRITRANRGSPANANNYFHNFGNNNNVDNNIHDDNNDNNNNNNDTSNTVNSGNNNNPNPNVNINIPENISAPLLNDNVNNVDVPSNANPVVQVQDRQLRRNGIDNIRNHEYESPKLLLIRFLRAFIETIATAIILSIGWDEKCSEPLKWWLLVYTSFNFMQLPFRIHIYYLSRHSDHTIYHRRERILKWIQAASFVCFLIGNSLLFSAKSCQSSSPTIWWYCLILIICVYIALALPFLIVIAICICLPCVLIIFRFFAEPEGADNEIITKLPTKIYVPPDTDETKIKHETKQNENDDDDDEEKPSCAICMQPYKQGDKLRVLPCSHEFHIDCVDKWLPLKKVCPLCRHDITKPMTSNNQNNNDNARNNNDNNSNNNELNHNIGHNSNYKNNDNNNDNNNNNNNNNNGNSNNNSSNNNVPLLQSADHI